MYFPIDSWEFLLLLCPEFIHMRVCVFIKVFSHFVFIVFWSCLWKMLTARTSKKTQTTHTGSNWIQDIGCGVQFLPITASRMKRTRSLQQPAASVTSHWVYSEDRQINSFITLLSSSHEAPQDQYDGHQLLERGSSGESWTKIEINLPQPSSNC